jgi:hypothetical protein
MKPSHKALVAIASYLGIGVAYLAVNEGLWNTSILEKNVLFNGFSGNESRPVYFAEAVGLWPVALIYGLLRGDPRYTFNTGMSNPRTGAKTSGTGTGELFR